jgi:hypothetical protein
LIDLIPSAGKWVDAVRVIDSKDLPDRTGVNLHADAMKQKVVCYLQSR